MEWTRSRELLRPRRVPVSSCPTGTKPPFSKTKKGWEGVAVPDSPVWRSSAVRSTRWLAS